jgi:fatty-acyl-CoA synthase
MASTAQGNRPGAGKHGAERSLWDPLNRRGARSDHLLAWDGGRYAKWSWEEWRDRALRFAGGLRRLGVQPGDRVACLLTNSPEACSGVLGVWLTGATLLSLPLIARGMEPAVYISQLRRIIAQSEPVLVICDQSFLHLLEDAEFDVRAVGFQRVEAESRVEPNLLEPGAAAFVQYTSGSTTEPRGCVLTPRAIAHQLATLERALDIDPERDVGVVWLPLSHDMGLFGCLLVAYWAGSGLVLSTPQRFLTNPGSWFEDCARYRATISAAPNFAIDVATRVAEARMPPPFPMRRLVVGGERVEAATLRRAAEVLGDERLRLSALVPAYGLAEAVLAVTMAPLDQEPMIVHLDGGALAGGEIMHAEQGESNGRSSAVALVSAGQPLPGNDVRIRAGVPVGEVVVQSPSLADGYLGAPEATAERFTSDGLLTGDVGFLNEGNLYVTGRLDDLMIVAGRNVHARDLEASLSGVVGVRPGGYSIIDVDDGGTTRLVALVEPRRDHPDLSLMAADIGAAVRAGSGITIADFVFVEPGRLPKTPSGKVQRFRCREMAADVANTRAVRIRL